MRKSILQGTMEDVARRRAGINAPSQRSTVMSPLFAAPYGAPKKRIETGHHPIMEQWLK